MLIAEPYRYIHAKKTANVNEQKIAIGTQNWQWHNDFVSFGFKMWKDT